MITNPGTIVADFVESFSSRDVARLAAYLDRNVEFEAYGDDPIVGRDAVLTMWNSVFANFDNVEFTTLHQAVNGEIVIEEQIHGLALPGRGLAPIKNVAVYRVRDGLIAEWRDYTNPQYAQTLL